MFDRSANIRVSSARVCNTTSIDRFSDLTDRQVLAISCKRVYVYTRACLLAYVCYVCMYLRMCVSISHAFAGDRAVLEVVFRPSTPLTASPLTTERYDLWNATRLSCSFAIDDTHTVSTLLLDLPGSCVMYLPISLCVYIVILYFYFCFYFY